MEIFINNQQHTVSENTSLQTLVNAQLGDKQKGVAVAINDAVIPKSNWENHFLQSNDVILIIKATQGG
ncbi:MAG: sulfur carrier protein ThiS [Bacteroidota bacterium]